MAGKLMILAPDITPDPSDARVSSDPARYRMAIVRVGRPDGEEVIGCVEVRVTLHPGVVLSDIEHNELFGFYPETGSPGMLELMGGYGEERCYSDAALLSFRRKVDDG